MAIKEVEIIYNPDGTMNIDQKGWEGHGCEHAIDDLLKTLGNKKDTRRKADNFIPNKVKIKES